MNHLITIPMSHYCEKARWALEYTAIPYTEVKCLQLFNMWHTYRAAGTDEVPVLVTPEGVFDSSTKILHWADKQAAEGKKLYPDDPVLRSEIEVFENDLNEQFGVHGRLWMYTYLLSDLPLIMKYSRLHGIPNYQIRTLSLLFPFMKGWVMKLLDMKDTSRIDSARLVGQTLDQVAARVSKNNGTLFGRPFTAAELTFASLCAPVIFPESYGVPLPKLNEIPDEMSKQIEEWRKHPAAQYALDIYRRYRHTRQ